MTFGAFLQACVQWVTVLVKTKRVMFIWQPLALTDASVQAFIQAHSSLPQTLASSLFCRTCNFLSILPSPIPLPPQVKTAYVEFLMHCYIDTDVEIKEIYTRNHMWVVFNNFVEDIEKVRHELP